MWVKICANTSLADARTAVDAGADAVGFVFAKSKRQMTGDAVGEITAALPEGVEKVGVFATDDPFEVEHWVVGAGLTVAQLHRPFDEGMVRALSGEFGGELKIVQTVAYDLSAPDREVVERRFVEEIWAVAGEPAVWAILVDAARGGVSGGLGVAFDWKRVGALVREGLAATPERRVVLAGGLTPGNVGEAVAAFAPWGVDVASGVEARVGEKSAAAVREFVEKARGA